MVLRFNDGTELTVQTAQADGSRLVVTLIRSTSEIIKGKFGDAFAMQRVMADGEALEGYTVLDSITEHLAGIWEVVNLRPEATTEERLAALEGRTEEQTAINAGQDECIVELYEMLTGGTE